MEFKKGKKLTIITEASIQDRVTNRITKLGADGYTIEKVTGKGSRKGIRDGTGIGGTFTNIKIDVITTPEIAEAISDAVKRRYFKNYAGLLYMVDVDVIKMDDAE